MSPATWAALGFAPLPPHQAARLEAQGLALASGRTPTVRQMDPLRERAAVLWPESPYLQREWMRAVRAVRRTPGGWLLDRNVSRHA